MPLRKTKKNNKIKQGYKFAAFPNKEQKEFFAKTFGCSRKYWNMAKSDCEQYYRENKIYNLRTPGSYKEEYPFLDEVDSQALCNAQLNLNTAFTNFFKKKGGYPSFKSKNDKQSYTTSNQKTKAGNFTIYLLHENGKDYIKLPKIEPVEIKIHRKIKGKIKNVTVTKTKSGKYFVSIMCEQEVEYPEINYNTTNIDALDYKSSCLYRDKDGDCNMPHFYAKAQKRLRIEQHKLSRMKKGSNNYNKQKRKIAKISEHIANQRKDFLHKQSSKIANLYDAVVVEDINMQSIAKHKSKYKLGKATYDNGYGMFRSMLKYKLAREGKLYILADKTFPSTQLCSTCNFQNKELKDLSIRTWTCPCCGTVHDRDENAVINLLNFGINYINEVKH